MQDFSISTITDNVTDGILDIIKSVLSKLKSHVMSGVHGVVLFFIESGICVVIITVQYFTMRISFASNEEKFNKYIMNSSISAVAYFVLRYLECYLIEVLWK